jgi:hypothetical protein
LLSSITLFLLLLFLAGALVSGVTSSSEVAVVSAATGASSTINPLFATYCKIY